MNAWSNDSLRIDGDRLWHSLMEMARIGATQAGGSCRLALTDADREGRDLFVAWCREAGCEVSIDRMGNIFARRPGRARQQPPVGSGSHLDTQPHGGRFDGVFGVLAGLEVLRTLNDHGMETQAPLELVVWTNEEGARFPPSMMGSRVFAGTDSLATAYARRDSDGHRAGDELARIGYAGDQACGNHPFTAFFEAHIEQGPLLEAEDTTIGVVTAVQGQRWYDVKVIGQDAHTGSTPMRDRRNALVGAAAMVSAVDALAHANPPDTRATVGSLQVSPNSRNTIPGAVDFTIDLRHPDAERLSKLHHELSARVNKIAADHGLEMRLQETSATAPVAFDRDCVAAVRDAAAALGYRHRDIVSGAGHDACYVAQGAPTAMIFVPCAGGLSHNEAESAEPADLEAGGNVLLHALLHGAGR